MKNIWIDFMIIRSETPLRLGLTGGGNDVSPYSDIYGGLILNATINLYAYCTIEETRNNSIILNNYDSNYFKYYPSTRRMEIDGEASLIEDVYNRIVKNYGLDAKSFKIATYNDAPARLGLGISSTVTVCILKYLVEWLGLPLGDYEISRPAYEIGRKDLSLFDGRQDQYATAFGGFSYVESLQNDMVIINPLRIKCWIIDELETSMLLFFTGRSRSSAATIEEQKRNTSSGGNDAIEATRKIKQNAKGVKLAILKGDVSGFADTLHEDWESKKKMASNITNPVIQEAMDIVMIVGAKAGKVSGAGDGGFIMFIVEPTHKKEVEGALKRLHGLVIPFQFSDGGVHGWKMYPTDTVGPLSIK